MIVQHDNAETRSNGMKEMLMFFCPLPGFDLVALLLPSGWPNSLYGSSIIFVYSRRTELLSRWLIITSSRARAFHGKHSCSNAGEPRTFAHSSKLQFLQCTYVDHHEGNCEYFLLCLTMVAFGCVWTADSLIVGAQYSKTTYRPWKDAVGADSGLILSACVPLTWTQKVFEFCSPWNAAIIAGNRICARQQKSTATVADAGSLQNAMESCTAWSAAVRMNESFIFMLTLNADVGTSRLPVVAF